MSEVDIRLAPYAQHEQRSRGRRHEEPPPRHRGEYQRDRDRIVHSTAFRRLVYKTQVFVNHEGDLYRTRLTHSLEVAQIARSVAGALRLNEPLTEAICLAHDLGHTPFGHAGQDALNECMREFGGFEHNLQSLRVVDELEERYADFPGLNLMQAGGNTLDTLQEAIATVEIPRGSDLLDLATILALENRLGPYERAYLQGRLTYSSFDGAGAGLEVGCLYVRRTRRQDISPQQ